MNKPNQGKQRAFMAFLDRLPRGVSLFFLLIILGGVFPSLNEAAPGRNSLLRRRPRQQYAARQLGDRGSSGEVGFCARRLERVRELLLPKDVPIYAETDPFLQRPLKDKARQPFFSWDHFKVLTLNLNKGIQALPKAATLSEKRLGLQRNFVLQRTLLATEPDLVLLQEAAGLEEFTWHYLQGRYEAVLIRGAVDQSSGGTTQASDHVMGVLVKKVGRSSSMETSTEIHYGQWQDPTIDPGSRVNKPDSPLFPKGVSITKVRRAGSTVLIVIGVHLKAPKFRTGDPESLQLRTAQVNDLVQLTDRLRAEFPEAFILLGGDLNTPGDDPLFEPLRESYFDSVGPKSKMRSGPPYTQYVVDSESGRFLSRDIDGFWFSPGLSAKVSQYGAIPFIGNRDERTLALPHEWFRAFQARGRITPEQKRLLTQWPRPEYSLASRFPSDHLPVLVEMKIPR